MQETWKQKGTQCTDLNWSGNEASDKLARQKVSCLSGNSTQLRGDIGELGKQIDNRNLFISFSFVP